MMVEHGQAFWKDGWQPLYSLLGGNPLAAMPSLHFATSLMAARLLSEVGPVPGAIGWSYALTLGFALVYLGEHYLVDLLAGAALTEGVRRIGPRVAPLLHALSADASGPRGGGTRVTEDRAPRDARGWPTGAAVTDDEDEMPRVAITRERMIVFAVFVVSAVAFMYFVLPKLAGLHKTWNRLQDGEPGWLVAAAGFEVLSYACYMWLFRTVFVRAKSRIGWKESYEITMAGVAATRLFAAAGAGGVALTAWAVRKSGMSRRNVAVRMIAFMSMLYSVYVSGARGLRDPAADRRAARRASVRLHDHPGAGRDGAVDRDSWPSRSFRATSSHGFRSRARGRGPRVESGRPGCRPRRRC